MFATIIKIVSLLNDRQLRLGILISLLMVFGTLLEMLGVGLVIPVLGVAISGDFVSFALVPESLANLLSTKSIEQIFVGGILAIALIFCIKNLLLLGLVWVQSSFVFSINQTLTERLFHYYLSQPYIIHVNTNTALRIRNITIEVNFLTQALKAWVMILSEVLVLVGVSAVVVFVEPLIALTVGSVFFIVSALYYSVINVHLAQWGKRRQISESGRIQVVKEGLDGIKETKIFGRESDFMSRFNDHNAKTIRTFHLQNFATQIPRIWLEVLAVLGLCLVAIVAINTGNGLDTVLPLLALYGVAAFRLMPSLNRCLHNMQTARFATSSVNAIYDDLVGSRNAISLDAIALPLIDLEKEIKLDKVSFRYDGNKSDTLTGVSLAIKRGEKVGVIGASGSGKTTLIDIILGLLEPTKGQVTFDGKNINSAEAKSAFKIGYVPQSIFLTDDTITRNVAFGFPDSELDTDRVWKSLEMANLAQFVKTLPDQLQTIVGERGVRLSGGQIQRIGLARALYNNPQCIVLDEATSALDIAAEKAIMDTVNKTLKNKTIIIIAHRKTALLDCDRIYRVENGQVFKEQRPLK